MADVVAKEPLATLDYAEVLPDRLVIAARIGDRPPDRQPWELPLMRRRMMKSKIHRATVTGAELDYAGSISLDTDLMKRADILECEQVAVLDVDNGNRFETYAIAGDAGQVQLNGAAARLVEVGHRVIVITYADYDDAELSRLRAADGEGRLGTQPRRCA